MRITHLLSVVLTTVAILGGSAPAQTVKFDFGAAATNAGYVAVGNTVTYSAVQGYGWLSTTGLVLRDRGGPDDLRRDFIFKNSSGSNVFRVSGLDPGLYLLKVVFGDAQYGDHRISMSVAGAGTLPEVAPRTSEFVTLSVSVTVDGGGTLDITFGSPTNNWVVNALTLEPTTEAVPPTTEGEFLFTSQWDPAVFASDPTQPLLNAWKNNTESPIIPTGLTRADYLRIIAGEIDFWKTKQNSSGAIIDPYTNSEIQYSTPAFAHAAATLVAYANRTDLIETASKAMDWATLRLGQGLAASNHDDFYPGMLAHALILLEPQVPASRVAAWKANLNFNPYTVYTHAAGDFNWNVVASSGESLLQKLGIRTTNTQFVAQSWLGQGKYFTSPYGLYMEGPVAYDHFPRIWFEDALEQGYAGPGSTEVKTAMDRAAITSLFMQSPWGEMPAGGRSAQHQWNEAEQCVTYEIYASKAKAAGDARLAGAYKRGAHLGLASMFRWVRPSGEMQIVKNWVNPSSRHGYEGYSYHSQYNLLPMAMLSMAYEYAAATEDVSERAAPADTGGFVFKIDGLDKVLANAGGTYVELDTTADHHYDATGLIRVHRKGVSPQLGPSDSLLSAASYNSPNDSTVTTGVCVSWQDFGGTWHTLGEMGDTEIDSAVVTTISQSPSHVVFDVTYTGSMGGVATVIEHYTVTPDGVQLTTELPGYFGPLRYVWPVLSSDGKTSSTINVTGNTVSVSQGGPAQTFTAPGAQSVRVETNAYSNHNGWARLGVAEFPSGGKITFLIGLRTPVPAIAGSLLVDLQASEATGAGTAAWANAGSLGPFSRTGTPALVTNVAGTGLPGVQFNGSSDAYISDANTTAGVEGNSDRSIEVWAYNPTLAAEEGMVSWGRRGATRTNLSLNYGNSGSWGGVTHFSDDLAWGTVPSAGAWHHLVYVYSGAGDARIYLDGALSKSKTLGGPLATTAANPINIGAQRNLNGTLTNSVNFSGYINSVRVHDGALTADHVAENFAIGPVTTPTSATPVISPIGNQTLAASTVSAPIGLTLSDSDTPLNSLTLTGVAANAALIPSTNIVFGGSDGSRTVVLTPAPGFTGTTTVTVVVSDGTTSSMQSFDVNVLTPLQAWRQEHFGVESGNEEVAGDLVDPDGDAIPNLLERALGGNPMVADTSVLPQTATDLSQPVLTLTYRKAVAATDLVITVQQSSDPSAASWEVAPTTPENPQSLGVSNGVETFLFSFPIQAGHSRKFLRIQVTGP